MKPFLLLGLLFSTIMVRAQLNGNYTIGGVAPDYLTITSAVTDLNLLGVSGNVNFKLRPGTYDEKIDLIAVSGASPSAIVTFESESADTASVWWTSSSTNATDNYVIKCTDLSYISIQNISFRNNGTYGSSVILLENETSNFTFNGNHIAALSAYYNNLDRHILIKSAASADSNIVITNNNLELGGYGIQLLGTDPFNRDSTLTISNNMINATYGIYLNNVENVVLSGNKVTSWEEPMRVNGFGTPMMIDHNDFYSSQENGLLLEYNSNNDSPSPLYRTRILNNFVKAKKSGINAESANLDIINNTLYTVFNGYGAVNLESDANLMNNILYCETAIALRLASNSINVNSNNNLFYSPWGAIIYDGTTVYNTLVDWVTASGQDQNSYYGATQFASITDLHIVNSAGAYNNATSNFWISDDIDGDIRPASPDIGADEFIQPAVDATMSNDYIVDTSYICAGMNTVFAKIVNTGTDNLTSALLQLEINGIPQPSVVWNGSLSLLDTSSFIMLNYNLPQDSSLNFRVWVSEPNGITDPFQVTDTISISETVQTRMQGTYLIGDATMDYPSIQAATDDLNLRGTCNNVELRLKNGIYPEVIEFFNLNRTTPNDTLFINSISGNRDSVTWSQFNNYRPVTIYNTDNIYFSDLSFKMYQSGFNFNTELINILGYLYPFGNNYTTTNFLFDNCVFFTTYNGNFTGIKSFCSDLTIKNCSFKDLPYALSIAGGNQSDFTITNNSFSNHLDLVIGISGGSNIKIIGNQFTNNYTTYSGNYHRVMDLSNTTGELKIAHNRISGGYGHLLNINHLGTVSDPGEIFNNFFSAKILSFNGANSVIALPSDYIDFNSNSINVTTGPNPTGVSTVTVIGFGNTNHPGARVYNNTIKMDSAGYVFSGALNFLADYNNVFIDNLINGYELPVSTGNHQNSITVDPAYYSFDELYLTNTALDGMGIDLGLTLDIDSNLRISPPTIGAVESASYTYNLIVDSLYSIAYCDSFDLFCSIGNIAFGQIDSVLLIYSLDGTILDSIVVITDFTINNPIGNIYIGTYPIQYGQNQTYAIEAQILSNIDQFPLNNSDNNPVLYTFVPNNLDLGSDTTICNYNQLTLDAGIGMTSYFWSTTETTPTILIDGPTLGNGNFNFNVNVINENGCIFSDSIDVLIDGCAGIDALNTESMSNVYPIPTSGHLYIDLGEMYNGTTIKVYNTLGQIIVDQSFGITREINLEINGASGMYILEINTDEGRSERVNVIKM